MLKSLIYVSGIALVFSTSVSALVFELETADQLTTGFTTGADSNLFSQSGTGGLSGSGSVSVPSSADNQIWVSVDPFAGNTDNSFSFYFKTAAALGNVGYLSFGAVSNADATSGTGLSPNSGSYLGGWIEPSNGSFELKGEGAFNKSGSSLDTSMVANSWYYVKLTYDWQFNEFYGLTLEVNSSDSDGNVGASLISGGTFQAGLESSIAEDSSTYLYFGGGSSIDNVVANFDNLSSAVLLTTPAAVPEAEHFGMLAGLGAAFTLVMLRQRKRRN